MWRKLIFAIFASKAASQTQRNNQLTGNKFGVLAKRSARAEFEMLESAIGGKNLCCQYAIMGINLQLGIRRITDVDDAEVRDGSHFGLDLTP